MRTLRNTGYSLMLIAFSSMLVISSCKKDKKSPGPATEEPAAPDQTKKYTLVIDNGAQSVEQGKSLSYSAHLVSSNGSVISASGLSWSCSFGGFSGNVLSFNKDTTGIVSASVNYEGVTYKASVPVAVMPVKSSQLFAVVPSAIIWSTNAGTIPLNTVYFGSSASYTFTSQNNSIVSVSNTGEVTFNAPGSTNIIVKANLNGQSSQVTVPVLVLGVPEAPLPVAKVVVSPALGQMFKGETLQLTAKAFDINGNEVTNNINFTYSVIPKVEDDGVPTTAVSINNSGLITANALGGAYIQAMTNGIIGQAEVVVNPDTVVLVTPFYANLGGFDPMTMQPNPTSVNLTANTYKVNRTLYKQGNPNCLTQISNPAGLQWIVPTTGVPEIDNYFDIVTLSNATNTSVTATAKPGKVGSTVVVASVMGIYFGAASVLIMP